MKNKLWTQKDRLHPTIEAFTVGDDVEIDLELVPHDLHVNLAHAAMLKSVGILSDREHRLLRTELHRLQSRARKGMFRISREQEDVHTAVENHLTEALGDVGKKIHTGRSRNDQVLADLRLYQKGHLLGTALQVCDLVETLLSFSYRYRDIPLPGYTHMRKAMPSSVSLWASSYAEGLLEDLSPLLDAYRLCDRSPLGTGAGFGVPIRIDPKRTARLLGFGALYRNPIAAQNSRGKVEGVTLSALHSVAQDLSRLASDLLLFTTEEFGFFHLPDDVVTGSSIMPQKRNPDALELMRGSASQVRANLFEVLDLIAKLPSGYQRDLQLTKRPVIAAFRTTTAMLDVARILFEKVRPDETRARLSMTPELYAAERALRMAAKGVPFREAYLAVAKNPSAEASSWMGAAETKAAAPRLKELWADLRSARSRTTRIRSRFLRTLAAL